MIHDRRLRLCDKSLQYPLVWFPSLRTQWSSMRFSALELNERDRLQILDIYLPDGKLKMCVIVFFDENGVE